MSEKRRVLIAEDNAALARVVQFNMERAGFHAVVAPNGRIAWELAKNEHFDAVITDQQMPEMTGLELIEKLRELRAYQETPIIMLTAKGLELELPRLCEELRISASFAKPFSPTRVSQIIAELLGTPAATP